MTAHFRTPAGLETPPLSSDAALGAPGSAPAVLQTPAGDRWTDRTVFPALIVVVLLFFSALQNPYWVPAGDSELYSAAARSLAKGQGYSFLGQPVAISPPGWSWMMSLVMRVTSYVWPLKLLAMGCMLASLLMGYWIARRFVSPGKAAGVILLTAVLSHVYQATFWLISEGSFCLATTASILLAMQIRERSSGEGVANLKFQISDFKWALWWRIALLLVCCVAAVTIRWAGVLGIVVVVAALIDGEWKPRVRAPWVAAVLVVVVSVGTFYGWRVGLRGTAEQRAAAADAITGTGEDMGTAPVPDSPPVVGTADQNARAYQFFPPGSYVDRFLNWGRWFSYLYWQPFRAAAAKAWILSLSTLTGWVLIALLGVLVFFATKQRRWIWLGTGLYTGALAMGWPNVNARYYVPVAFLITLGIFLATDELTRLTQRFPLWRKALVGCFVVFVASVALCNGLLWGVEASIARSSRFYTRYEDGVIVPLIAACQHLNALPAPPADNEIAVSPRYKNLDKTRANPFGLRATVWMTDRDVINPRWKDTLAPPSTNIRLSRWLRSKGVKWYLYQAEVSPWRVWHFRLGWYEQWQTGKTAAKDSPTWQLYQIGPPGDEDDWTLVKLPRKCQPVTRVPGL